MKGMDARDSRFRWSTTSFESNFRVLFILMALLLLSGLNRISMRADAHQLELATTHEKNDGTPSCQTNNGGTGMYNELLFFQPNKSKHNIAREVHQHDVMKA